MSVPPASGRLDFETVITAAEIPTQFDPWHEVTSVTATMPGAEIKLILSVTVPSAPPAAITAGADPVSAPANPAASNNGTTEESPLAERALKVIRLYGPIYKSAIGIVLGVPVDHNLTVALSELSTRKLAHNDLRRGLWVATGAVIKHIPTREEQIEDARAGRLRQNW